VRVDHVVAGTGAQGRHPREPAAGGTP
jgi:hypothetical protein